MNSSPSTIEPQVDHNVHSQTQQAQLTKFEGSPEHKDIYAL